MKGALWLDPVVALSVAAKYPGLVAYLCGCRCWLMYRALPTTELDKVREAIAPILCRIMSSTPADRAGRQPALRDFHLLVRGQ